MERTEKLRNEIIDLEWNALPYYERWAYPKEAWGKKKFYLKKRLKSQKWEVRYTRTLLIILGLLFIGASLYPNSGWKIPAFFALSLGVVYWVERMMKKRLQLIQKAVELKKKLKKS